MCCKIVRFSEIISLRISEKFAKLTTALKQILHHQSGQSSIGALTTVVSKSEDEQKPNVKNTDPNPSKFIFRKFDFSIETGGSSKGTCCTKISVILLQSKSTDESNVQATRMRDDQQKDLLNKNKFSVENSLIEKIKLYKLKFIFII